MKHEPIAAIALAALVDELAALKATVSPIEERMEAIKDRLKAAGLRLINPPDKTAYIEGTQHRAAVTVSDRETVDTKRLRADLGEDIWATYVSSGLPIVTCKVTARKTR
jgi:hypothetical protein